MKWYELDLKTRYNEVYKKYSLVDFFYWWTDKDAPEWMEIRFDDWKIAKECSLKHYLKFIVNIRNIYKGINLEINMIKKDTKEIILEYVIKKGKEPTTSKEIAEQLKISYPTLTKYLAVLEAEEKIIVNDYGNIKFYYGAENVKKK